MKKINSSNKVISLSQRISDEKRKDTEDNYTNSKSNTNIIAVSSGKGGVGKSNIVANLGLTLCRMGKRVLVLDADFGLGNLDVLLGLVPKYDISHVLMGTKSIQEITLKGPGNIKLLPAPSGIQELTKLTEDQISRFSTQLDAMLYKFDVLLIDTATGISSNVMHFTSTAHEIVVVVTPEAPSITNAYALIKVLSLKYSRRHFKLLVNLADSIEESREVFDQLNYVTDRFLNITMEYLGHILNDENVTKSMKRRQIVCKEYPTAKASKCYISLAKKICESATPESPTGGSCSFKKHFLKNIFE